MGRRVFLYYTFILLYRFVYHIFMTSPLRLAVGPHSILGGLFTNFLNMPPFEYTTFVVSGKVGYP